MDWYIGGGLSILVGIMICFQPVLNSQIYGHTFDFTGYNVPFGCALIIFGMLAIWSEIRKKMRQRKQKTKTDQKEPPSQGQEW